MSSEQAARKGRGATFNPDNRFFTTHSTIEDDGWTQADELPPLKTQVMLQHSKSIISRNQSPDLPFSQSINPYQGCEHGCIYCFARPTHAYLDLSAGLDFETKLFVKQDAATLLREELSARAYTPQTIMIGANTDPYQPIERKWRITRQLLEVMLEYQHPVSLITKNALVLRDIDLLSKLAEKNLVQVFISVTSLDAGLSQVMEPRASAPHRRLKTIEMLAAHNIPVGVLVSPIIPVINDAEIERILESAANAGAVSASYALIRLPYEVSSLFINWLETHYPLKAQHVMSVIRDTRGGKNYDSAFETRMSGQGVFAQLIRQRFNRALIKNKLSNQAITLAKNHFLPRRPDGQLDFFI